MSGGKALERVRQMNRFRIDILVTSALVFFSLSSEQSLGSTLNYTVKTGVRIIIHGARKGCDGKLPSLAWAQKQIDKVRLAPASGSLSVGAHSGQTRFSKSCGKSVPVLPVYYQAPTTKGKNTFTVFGDKVTVVVN